MENNQGYYYRFIYKDSDGKLGYTIVNVPKQDNELAIAKFEKVFPDLVWRRFEEVTLKKL
jgi:hypothetical protein